MTLADLITADGRTADQLAAATPDGTIGAAGWRYLATTTPTVGGRPWRPRPGIVAAIAAALGVPDVAVRSALVNSHPAKEGT
jgi:hypothetical protein